MHPLESALPMILNRTLDGVMPPYRALFKRFDITEQQWRVLRVLWSSERESSAELAAQTLIPAPSLVGVIDRLEKKGLVSRFRSLEDRRMVYVSATDIGRRLERLVSPEVDALHSAVKDVLSPAEWDAMVKTLDKINTAMRDDALSPATQTPVAVASNS